MAKRTRPKAPARGPKPTDPARKPRRKRRVRLGVRRWLAWSLLVPLSCVLAAVVGLWRWGERAGDGPGQPGPALRELALVTAEPSAVAAALHGGGWLESPASFVWFRALFHGDATFELGPHWLPARVTPRELVSLLARQRSRPVHKLTVPEGFDLFQIARRLEELGICSARAFEAAALRAPLGELDQGAPSHEGYLYPATYELRSNTPPGVVVQRMFEQAELRHGELFGRASAELEALHRELGLDRHELVVLASIVQKEAASKDEMGNVASVFLNRLRDASFKPKGVLQSDPTAGYGCKLPTAPSSCRGYQGSITPLLLRDEANRYNTYKHPGLPPGPIANPGADALWSVLQAPRTSYFYFVLGKDGRHVFSRSYEEHKAAIGGRAGSGQ